MLVSVLLLSSDLMWAGNDWRGEIWPLASICRALHSSAYSTLYMKLLGELICCYVVTYHQYADAFQLYSSAPGKLSNAIDVLSQCLEAEDGGSEWGTIGFNWTLARMSGSGFWDLPFLRLCDIWVALWSPPHCNTFYGAAIEEYLEASAGIECGGQGWGI